MHLNNVFLRSFRILLFPFALLYGAGVMLRNWMYDKNILKSTRFNLPVICVGNLSVGGTGKSPMVEYLAGLLKDQFRTATLSPVPPLWKSVMNRCSFTSSTRKWPWP
jgi:tetraacyldisaccharide 4'-kinase